MTKQMAALVALHNEISAARAAYRALWVKACESDGIEPSSKFVVFSDGNPHKGELEIAGAKLLTAISKGKPQNSEGVCA